MKTRTASKIESHARDRFVLADSLRNSVLFALQNRSKLQVKNLFDFYVKPHRASDKLADFLFRRLVFFHEPVDKVLPLFELFSQSDALIRKTFELRGNVLVLRRLVGELFQRGLKQSNLYKKFKLKKIFQIFKFTVSFDSLRTSMFSFFFFPELELDLTKILLRKILRSFTREKMGLTLLRGRSRAR